LFLADITKNCFYQLTIFYNFTRKKNINVENRFLTKMLDHGKNENIRFGPHVMQTTIDHWKT
jgi:hypothetical protein